LYSSFLYLHWDLILLCKIYIGLCTINTYLYISLIHIPKLFIEFTNRNKCVETILKSHWYFLPQVLLLQLRISKFLCSFLILRYQKKRRLMRLFYFCFFHIHKFIYKVIIRILYAICFKYLILIVLTHIAQRIIFNIFVNLFILILILYYYINIYIIILYYIILIY